MWIKCSEKLPIDHGRFLVATGNGTVLFLEWNDLNKQWGKCGTDVEYWTMVVTHWQPVPAPPTAENSEGANLQPLTTVNNGRPPGPLLL